MHEIKKLQTKLGKHAQLIVRSFIPVSIILIALVISLSISVRTASAGPGTPFGGLITYVFTCTCSGNFAVYFQDLTISPPITLPLIYQPGGTIVYAFGPPLSIGSWMLGTWQSGGQCRYYVGKGCATLPTAGTMYMVGTSM